MDFSGALYFGGALLVLIAVIYIVGKFLAIAHEKYDMKLIMSWTFAIQLVALILFLLISVLFSSSDTKSESEINETYAYMATTFLLPAFSIACVGNALKSNVVFGVAFSILQFCVTILSFFLLIFINHLFDKKKKSF